MTSTRSVLAAVLLLLAIAGCNWSLTGTRPPAGHAPGCRDVVLTVRADSLAQLPDTLRTECHPLPRGG